MYLFDLLLEDPEVQTNGFVTILDFANTPFRMNNPAQKDLNELFDALPARFAAGMFTNTPWWFSIAFKIVSSFTRSKLVKMAFFVFEVLLFNQTKQTNKQIDCTNQYSDCR